MLRAPSSMATPRKLAKSGPGANRGGAKRSKAAPVLPAALPAALLDRIHIVLVEPQHPGNVGAAARAMKTMGLGRLHLVRPREFPSPEAEARAAGADDVLLRAEVAQDLVSATAGFALML